MALAGGGAEAATRTLGFLRVCSSALVRSFSSTTTINPPPPLEVEAAEALNPKPKRRRKKKNLFEVAQFLPNWGIGYLMAKNHWHGTSYKITKLNLYKDGRHGKAWGIFYKDGLPNADGPKKISGVHKRGWKYIPEPRKNQLTVAATIEKSSG